MKDARPKLQDKPAFEAALRNYQPSTRARDVLARTQFVALSGMAGGGRNTVIRLLTANDRYIFAVSDTTRPPKFRDGKMEQEGINYYFRKEADVLRDIQNGEFIEAEIIHDQQVSGISVREVEHVIQTGKIPIRDFEYGGIKNIVAIKPDAVIIGLLPPSYKEWTHRLAEREQIHHKEFLNRLHTAEKVLENMLGHSYFKLVVNDSLDTCVAQIRRIVEDKDYSQQDDRKARQIAEELLKNVRKELQSDSPSTL
jgi:guanylate kinase